MIHKACSSVDRASDSDSESRGFDSLHAYLLNIFMKSSLFINVELKQSVLLVCKGAAVVLTFKH